MTFAGNLLVRNQNQLFFGAAGAYSLRSLNLGATNVVRVRRSSDNTESDFTASQITDGTLASWVGAGNNGFVRTWYDQSGNNRHLEQTSTTAQPQIVSSGTVLTENGTPRILFNGNNNYLFFTGSTGISATLSAFAVLTKITHVDNEGMFSFIPSGASPNNRDWASSDGRAFVMNGLGQSTQVSFTAHIQFSGSNGFSNPVDIKSTITIGSSFLWSAVESGGTASSQINGGTTLTDTYNGTPTAPNGLVVGARYDTTYQQFGNINAKEIIYYGTDKSADVSAIRTNINSYYSIY